MEYKAEQLMGGGTSQFHTGNLFGGVAVIASAPLGRVRHRADRNKLTVAWTDREDGTAYRVIVIKEGKRRLHD